MKNFRQFTLTSGEKIEIDIFKISSFHESKYDTEYGYVNGAIIYVDGNYFKIKETMNKVDEIITPAFIIQGKK